MGNPAELERMAAIWREALGVPSVALEDNYFDLGGDSSLALALFARIEREFGRRLPLAALFSAPTLGELTDLATARTAPPGGSLVAIRESGARPAFYLVHDAGGEVLGYRALAAALGLDQPVYGLQAQGLNGSRPRVGKIEEMAAAYAAEICRFQPTGPYYLGGYCGGGTIAFEIAQQLRRASKQVALLALLNTFDWSRVPPATLGQQLFDQCQRVGFFVANFVRLGGRERRLYLRQKLGAIRARVRAIPTRGIGRAWQADVVALKSALAAYEPQPYSGMLMDLRPARQYRSLVRQDAKWESLAVGGQRVIVLPVDPAGMMVEPFVEHLARTLRQAMDEAMAAPAAARDAAVV